MTNSIEEYQNLIHLLKTALKFYADKGNYSVHMGDISSIELDDYGSQARFALSKTNEFEKNNEKLENDFTLLLNQAETMGSEPNVIELINVLNEKYKND